MIYSRSSQYAIRSMVYLAGVSEGALCRLETIASQEGIPRHFLAKIMQRLVKKRLVRSYKGVRGGFSLAVPPDQVSLFAIIDAIDDLSLTLGDCILGCGGCSGLCSLHERWKKLKLRQLQFLQQTTIAEMTRVHRHIQRTALHLAKRVS